jgi:hypothetical protein
MSELIDLDAAQERYNHGTIASDPAVILASMADVPALVAELRVARPALDLLRPARAKIRQLLDEQGLRGDLPASIRQTLRQVHADLDGAVAAYDQHTTQEPGS